MATVLLIARHSVTGDRLDRLDGLEELCDDPNPAVAQVALQWSSQFHENQGDVRRAQECALRGARAGRRQRRAVDPRARPGPARRPDHADRRRWPKRSTTPAPRSPCMEALGADEDVAQLKAVLAVGAMQDGRIEEAERIFDEIEAADVGSGIFGAAIILLCGRPELELAAGRVEAGLLGYRNAVATLSSRSFPVTRGLPGPRAVDALHRGSGRRRPRPARPAGRGRRAPAGPAEQVPGPPRRHGGLPGLPGLRFGPLRAGDLGARVATRPRACSPSPYACSSTPTGSATTGRCRASPGRRRFAMAEQVMPGEVDRLRDELEGRRAPELRDEVVDLVAELAV